MLTNYGLNRLAVVPNMFLIVCTIDKCAQTTQLELLRHLANQKPLRKGQNPFTLSSKNREYLHQNLQNDSWKKMVVIRDPVERFVSAYKSKCLLADEDGHRHCSHEFKIPQQNMSIDIVIAHLEKKKSSNYHWSLQSETCGGIHNYIHHFTIIPFHNLSMFCTYLNCYQYLEKKYDKHTTNATKSYLTTQQIQKVKNIYKLDYSRLQLDNSIK